ncbi:hypothetical protein GPECTOR_2g1298 [Gonium pectorale]|uniref:Protein kinase domain-containing protein n=1 Tax=Gonium pectorale TaxID=33097 RepID=A0A150H1K5_GONPE|nr:hypothetical protein GPECTOR_2g1298 [Gonium pectorale]|eukprot:KXZ55748.1 hypothetical protein GPECTOR_2g1298 [Gonium pectorale]
MSRSAWSLSDYAVSKRLYKGSTSAVYKVHMLKREIEIQASLVHRHIARLYAAFMDELERVVLVQEYASQGDLFGILNRLGGRMAPEQVSDAVMRPFLEALVYLHSRGLCHRDIKPENILYNSEWKLKLADFGVAINIAEERAVTRAGTEGYMAPEVERCPLKSLPEENKDNPRIAYTTAVDVWAAGCLAYELLVGFPPVVKSVSGKEESSFVKHHMTAASLHFPASVPPQARAFVLAALAPSPEERPTAQQLLQHCWLQARPAPATVDGAAVVAAAQQASAVQAPRYAAPSVPATTVV